MPRSPQHLQNLATHAISLGATQVLALWECGLRVPDEILCWRRNAQPHFGFILLARREVDGHLAHIDVSHRLVEQTPYFFAKSYERTRRPGNNHRVVQDYRKFDLIFWHRGAGKRYARVGADLRLLHPTRTRHSRRRGICPTRIPTSGLCKTRASSQ